MEGVAEDFTETSTFTHAEVRPSSNAMESPRVLCMFAFMLE
jgi:hypothetical protein